MDINQANILTWRQFARMYPVAAKAINADAKRVTEHNANAARTLTHRRASLVTRVNYASMARTNIASGYTPPDVWPRIAREWAPKGV